MVAQITFLTVLRVVIGTKSPSGVFPVITLTRVYCACARCKRSGVRISIAGALVRSQMARWVQHATIRRHGKQGSWGREREVRTDAPGTVELCTGNGHLAEASQTRRAVLGLVLHAHIAADRVAIRARALRAGFAEHTPVWRNTLAQAVRTLFDRTAKQ